MVKLQMPIATFTLNDAMPQIFEVRWTWWGKEEYVYDGLLLQKLWDLTRFTGERSFQIDDQNVRISWSAEFGFQTRVYVNETIRVENLFPPLVIHRAPLDWKKTLARIAIWAVIGFVGTWIYKAVG